jgi:hypothetical protein
MPPSSLTLYQTEDGRTRLQVRREGETIRDSVVAESATAAADGTISREGAHRRAEEEYERFAARRRQSLEAQGEADLLGLLDAEVKKLPRKPQRPKP